MNTNLNQQWMKTIGLVGGLVACLGGITILQLSRINVVKSKLASEDVRQEVDKEEVKLNFLKSVPAFGFDNLVADWSMLQFIQYYGDGETRKQTGFGLSPDYLDIIVKNDPRFVQAYLAISPASSINAGLPERTIAAMDRGLSKLSPNVPNAYYLWLYKGVDELLFLGDIEAAKHSYTKSAEWAKIANNPFIEKSALGTVQYLSTHPNSRRPQVGAWFLVWINSQDRETRKMAQANIEKLGGQLVFNSNGQVLAVPPKED